MASNKLSRTKIVSLLRALNDILDRRKVTGEIYLLGGAVMCLAFKARDSTQDLDAIFEPKESVSDAAKEVARKHHLPDDWLNDAVKGFLSDAATFQPYLDLPSLKVFTATADYIFAMKCLSFRIGAEFADEADIRFLLRYLNVTSVDEAIAIVTRFYPVEMIPQKTFYALRELLG